jgi:glucosamine--fructose-6-phosphate aminotransferase (isomerizing)
VAATSSPSPPRATKRSSEHVEDVLYVPEIPEPLSPMLTVVPLQLMAYHAAVIRGHDVDKPRNLAKSVTVE